MTRSDPCDYMDTFKREDHVYSLVAIVEGWFNIYLGFLAMCISVYSVCLMLGHADIIIGYMTGFMLWHVDVIMGYMTGLM